MPPSVFISYRSEDTGATASRLARDLEQQFGRAAVFLDHDRLGGGDVWPQTLRAGLRSAAAVLVLIGSRWLSVQDPETGDRRLNLPEDWVRQEVEEALAAGRQLVPVLVDEARPLPAASLRTLPSIARLAELQAMNLRRRDWDGDVERIVQRLVGCGLVRLSGPDTGADAATAAAPAAAPAVAFAQPLPPTLPGVARGGFGAMGAGLLVLIGLVLWWRPQAPADGLSTSTVAAPNPGQRPGTASMPSRVPEPPAAPAPAPHQARPTEAAIEGAVEVHRFYAADYERLHDTFTIEAWTLREGRSLGEATLRRDQRFTIPVSSIAGGMPDIRLAWKRAAANPFVLWPVSPPQTRSPFQPFKFNLLDNIYVQERQAALSDVRAGDFAAGHVRLQALERLFDQYGDPQLMVIDNLAMGTLRFKLLQDICTAASQWRNQVGRSKVSDEMIRLEREWRKAQLSAAQASGQGGRSMVLALNGWAGFARQAYSRDQKAWADRPIGSRPGAMATPESLNWLREDLDAVRSGLEWLRDSSDRYPPLERLDKPRRALMDQVIAGNATDISMSRLSALLHQLQRP